MKKISKLFFILPVFVLALVILYATPVTVLAETIVGSGNVGLDGDDVNWTLNSEGVLKISGTGDMKNFSWANDQPWGDAIGGMDKITKVILEEGITSVGDYAFSGGINIKAVEFADSIKVIGKNAFEKCKLTKINFPSNLTTIESYAFGYCNQLKRVEFPTSLKTLQDSAFIKCENLRAVVFLNCNTVLEGNPFCYSYEVNLYALKPGKIRNFALNWRIPFEVISEMQVENCYLDEKLGTTSATITWESLSLSDGYKIYKYNSTSKKYELKKILGSDKKSYKITGLKCGNVYQYKVCSFLNIRGKDYAGKGNVVRFRTRSSSSIVNTKNNNIANGYTAALKTVTYSYSGLKERATNNYYHYAARVSDFCQFTDNKGNFCVAYVNKENTYVFIRAYNKNMKQVYYRKIKMLYPILGTVACDKEGYFYIVWGKKDGDEQPGTVTMAISKYKKDGTLIKSYKHKSVYDYDTKLPFRSGNCDVDIQDEILVCTYARQMYNGHQSSDMITIDTTTMKNIQIYDNYVSHSFDQRVLFDKYGIAWFVDQGDAFPRGFAVSTDSDMRSTYFEPFHFYAAESALQDMFVLNETQANLGGVVETSSGLVLVGSSVKSLKKSGYNSQKQNLFIMYVDSDKKMLDGVSRSGNCLGESVTDRGVKWLTSYTSCDVKNPQVVYTNDDRIVILWEKIKNGTWEIKWDSTYYMILSSNGKVLQKATKIKNAKLNPHEEPIYKDGYIYWANSGSETENSNKLKLYRLNLKSLIFDKSSLKVKGLKVENKTKSSVTIKWNNVSNADGYRIYRYNSSTKKYVKVMDVKASVQKCTVKKLKSGKNYTFAVKAYKKINGKTFWSDYTKIKVKTNK